MLECSAKSPFSDGETELGVTDWCKITMRWTEEAKPQLIPACAEAGVLSVNVGLDSPSEVCSDMLLWGQA